ncbi:MAG: hypothetical protein P8J87_04400, partial [Verrucomicrobiales bacterium]|nr:hypothetical protein [Verrucomicrobiales bacterium]
MNRAIPTLSLLALGTPLALAGTLGSPTLISGDADSGISDTLTYTHAVDLGTTDVDFVTINGVDFTAGIALGPLSFGYSGRYGWNTNSPNNHPGNTNTGILDFGDGIDLLLTDMRFGGSPSVTTLTGLLPGVEYEFRIYYRQWGANFNREHLITFDDGSGTPSDITIDQDFNNEAYYIG